MRDKNKKPEISGDGMTIGREKNQLLLEFIIILKT